MVIRGYFLGTIHREFSQGFPSKNRGERPTFLCPSDSYRSLHASFAPTNYAMCTGGGVGGGTLLDTDGVFFVNSQIGFKDILPVSILFEPMVP